jgi:outer membrane protein assembly factor BamB
MVRSFMAWTVIASPVIAGTVIAAAAGPLPAGEPKLIWPQFRGPTRMGLSSAKNVPTVWGPKQNLAWKIKLPGPGTSSPILVGDRIFLTCFTGYSLAPAAGSMEELRLQVLCLDRATGQTVWTKEIMPNLPETPRMRENHGYASHTPVADAERLYVFLGKSGVYAFDHGGKQLWHASVGEGLHDWGSAAPPTLHGNLLLVNACSESKSLVALDKRSGKEVWRAGGINESWNMPIVVSVRPVSEVVVATMGDILAFNAADGSRLWSCKTDIPWYMVPGLVSGDGVVYAIGGRNGGGALAVKAGGQGNVTATHRLWTAKNGSNVPSPILHGKHLYWMNDVQGIAFCADAKTGRIVYEERVPGAQDMFASPVLAEGRIYYLDRNGRTFVVAASPKFELLATNDLRERGDRTDRNPVNASPAVADGRLYVRTDSYLYCIGMK